MSDNPNLKDNAFIQTLLNPQSSAGTDAVFMQLLRQAEEAGESEPAYRREGGSDRSVAEIAADLELWRMEAATHFIHRDEIIGQLARAIETSDGAAAKKADQALSQWSNRATAIEAIIRGLELDSMDAARRETVEALGSLSKERLIALIERAAAVEALAAAEKRYKAASQRLSEVTSTIQGIETNLSSQWRVHPEEIKGIRQRGMEQAASEQGMDAAGVKAVETRAFQRDNHTNSFWH